MWDEQSANINKEIKRLTELVTMLQQHIAKVERECELLLAENSELTATNKQFDEIIARQADLITALQGRLSQDSSNSSKPSSTDGFKKVIHNNRTATGKKPGGLEPDRLQGHNHQGRLRARDFRDLVQDDRDVGKRPRCQGGDHPPLRGGPVRRGLCGDAVGAVGQGGAGLGLSVVPTRDGRARL